MSGFGDLYVYVHPNDLETAKEKFPALFESGYQVSIDPEVPPGRVITSNTPIFSLPIT